MATNGNNNNQKEDNMSAINNNNNIDIDPAMQGASTKNPKEGNMHGFNEQQEIAFNAIVYGSENVLLTGNAGTGKSYVVKHAIEELRNNGKNVVVCASTALAATAIGGVTMHSAFRIFPKFNTKKKTYDIDLLLEETKRDMVSSKRGEQMSKQIPMIDVIVIDEVSMLHRLDLERLEYQLRSYGRDENKPYGGVKMVFVGDFLQLEPVTGENTPIKFPAGTSAFAFETRKIWRDANVKTYMLEKIVRQQDEEFAKFLNNIRLGVWEDWMKPIVDKCRKNAIPQHGVPFFVSTNAEANRINTAKMEALPGESIVIPSRDRNPNKYDPQSGGWVENTEYWDSNCLALRNLELKVGALVLCLFNNPKVYMSAFEGVVENPDDVDESGLINGDSGVVTGLQEIYGNIVPVVRWNRIDREFGMKPISFSQGDPDEFRMQVPIKPCWAMTVHKAQGMTLDAAAVDVSKAFAAGQVYVAMSRVRTLDGLHILGFDPSKIKAHERGLKFYALTAAKNNSGQDAQIENSKEENIMKQEQTIKKEEVIMTKEDEMNKKKFIIAGSGTRQLANEKEKFEVIVKFLVGLIEKAKKKHGDNLAVMSGMAQGFDEALARAAMVAGVELIAAVPSRGYGEYYWKNPNNSATKTDRSADFIEIMKYAKETGGIVYTCGCQLTNSKDDCYKARHIKKGGQQNFDRNQFMVDQCDMLWVYNPNYKDGVLGEMRDGGTGDCLKRVKEAGKPYFFVTVPDDGNPVWLSPVNPTPDNNPKDNEPTVIESGDNGHENTENNETKEVNVQNNTEEKEEKMTGYFHGMVDIIDEETGKSGLVRVVTTNIEKYIEEQESNGYFVTIVESFKGGAYSFAFLDHFFSENGYSLEVRALKDDNADLPIHDIEDGTTIMSSTVDHQYNLVINGYEMWLSAFESIGLKIGNAKKMSKRNLELFRQACGFGYFDNVRMSILKPEDIVHNGKKGVNERMVDGISAISKTFAIRMLKGNPNYTEEQLNRKIKDIFNGKTTIVSFRMMTPHGLVKSNAIILPDKMMHHKDVITFSPNIKKEISTNGWYWATMEPSYGKLPLKSDDLTMAIYYGIEGIADDKNLLFTAEKAAAAMVNKIKGIDEDGDDIMDIIVDNSDVDKANPNKVSMLKQYTNQVEMLKDNGMDITASQTLMFLRANSFGMMTGILDNRSKPVLQGEVYTGDNGKWLPMPYAYRAHIMTRDVLEIFGFNFQQDENIGFYHKATHCFVVPGWFFDANYANHGGYDLDDTINVMIREVLGLNGEVKLRAFLLRNPNDFGEWSMIDVSEEEIKHCFHVYTDEIPTINEAELRTRVPQLTDMITNNLINYTYEELPGGSSLRINPVYGIDDERRIRSSIEVLPGGTGQTVLPKMLHYGITGSYVRNQLVSNEQIIDAVQQGVATIRDYRLIAEFCDAVNRSTVNWLRSNNKLVDYYWYATRMSKSPKAYKELGFWGRDFSFINTKENSPIMQLMLKREEIFRAHYAELVRWANNEPKAPEFISNAFTHDEVIAVHKQFDNVRTRYFASGTTKDWCEDFINIVNRKDATAEGGADETNEMILKLYLYGFIMKGRKPKANYDQWLFSSHKDLDVQPVDIFIRAARALRNNGRRNN